MKNPIRHIIEQDEIILWQGKQDLRTVMIIGVFCSILFLSISSFLFFSSENETLTANTSGDNSQKIITVLASILLSLAFFAPLAFYLNYKITDYVVSSKRVIIKSGLIGADIRSIYYDQVRSAFVKVDMLGKLFGSGSILMDTGRITQTKKGHTKTAYDRFRNIKMPYNVYKLMQKGLSSRKEGLHSGRADFESNQEGYKDFIQETERMKREASN